jgi:hypothetical protein
VASDDKDRLHVVFSMDCLPAEGKGDVGGPESWQDAARAPAAFAEALADEGLGGTFFLAPEALGRLARTVEELRGRECELGLLCHPQLSGYQACLGSYKYDRQREIVAQGVELWSNALGEAPTTFRAGFFSANDYTFHVLCMHGFSQGSCSLPGRMDNEQCSMWFDAYPFAHHTDPLDRTAKGTMEFFEVPVTSDSSAASFISQETFTPPHLRIEEPEVHDYARDLVLRQLDGMAEEALEPKVVHFVTSNLVGWGRPDDPHVERLQNLCTMLRGVAEQRGMELHRASLSSVHEAADSLLPGLRDEDAQP